MKVTINQKAFSRLRRGHPWIFRSDLLKIEAAAPGPVEVYSSNQKLLGQALFSPQSQISLRMMTRGEEKIDAQLLRQRLEAALAWRRRALPGENSYRVVFGEADGIPSFILDRYESTLVFQTLSAGLETFKADLIDLMRERLDPGCIVERNDVPSRDLEGLERINQIAWNREAPVTQITLLGKTYNVDLLSGQKTGFFLDQRLNAQGVGPYLSGRLLDAFSHSGQFALMAGDRVEEIHCVDQSESALEQIKRNREQNPGPPLQTHQANVFDFLKAQQEQGSLWDSVVLDPPAFVKSRKALSKAKGGYKEINLRAMKILRSGGILATFSCSQNLSRDEFIEVLHDAATDAKRRVTVVEELGQPPDHPWDLAIPETRYLKGFVLRVH